MLWLCVLLPALSLEVFTRAQAAAGASALRLAITTGGHHPRILIASDAATSCGIASQQLVSAAFALAPDLVLRERDGQAERAALRAVATWLTQFTPMVSLGAEPAEHGVNVVLAEIGGSVRLFGGLNVLLQQIRQGVCDLGFSVQIACAPSPTAARFLACAGQGRPVLERAELASTLAPLPVAHLTGHEEAIALLRKAGVRSFGEACTLPRDALARRAGKAFVAALDRARDLAPDPQLPFVPPARYEGRLELPVPVANVEALGFAVNRLVHEMSGWLLGRGLGVTELALSLEHERYMHARSGAATTVPFALASPARDVTHLTAVLRERLARVALPAPVESVMLASKTTAPLAGRNLGLLPMDDQFLPESSRRISGRPFAAASTTAPLLDRLRARLGEDAVTCIMPLEDHRPERAWQASATLHDAVRTRASCALPSAPRPVWLLTEAQPLGATFEDKPWILRDGPERIESGWWDGTDIRRDYYIAQSPRGEMLWIYRDSVFGPDGEWFLHGIFA